MSTEDIQSDCLQYILLGNCTHPQDCKKLVHFMEEEKVPETVETKEITKKTEEQSGTKEIKGSSFLSFTPSSKPFVPSNNTQDSTSTRQQQNSEERKPKKKLELKKGNDFNPTNSFFPTDLKLTSQKSVESTKSRVESETDSFNPQDFYENMNSGMDSYSYNPYGQDDDYPYPNDIGPGDGMDYPEDNDDPAYFHQTSADCECCKGYINSCSGGICDSLGYCYCYANELEDRH